MNDVLFWNLLICISRFSSSSFFTWSLSAVLNCSVIFLQVALFKLTFQELRLLTAVSWGCKRLLVLGGMRQCRIFACSKSEKIPGVICPLKLSIIPLSLPFLAYSTFGIMISCMYAFMVTILFQLVIIVGQYFFSSCYYIPGRNYSTCFPNFCCVRLKFLV